MKKVFKKFLDSEYGFPALLFVLLILLSVKWAIAEEKLPDLNKEKTKIIEVRGDDDEPTQINGYRVKTLPATWGLVKKVYKGDVN